MNIAVQNAFDYCENLAKSHYENFPVASKFVTKEKRKYIWAVYAFARMADDSADEEKNPIESLKQLNDWESKLEKTVQGNPNHPVFVALEQTIKDCQIPPSLLFDLLHAFKMDQTKMRYQSFEELLTYCQYSANPIGRLVLLIHGYQDEKLFQYSDAICSALQLTNFWQDIEIDLDKDRIYLPTTLLQEYHYKEEDLFKKIYDKRFISIMQSAIKQTKDLFLQGFPLIQNLNKDLQFEIKITWRGGMKILEKIEKNQYDIFNHRPTLNWIDKISIFSKSCLIQNQPKDKGRLNHASV